MRYSKGAAQTRVLRLLLTVLILLQSLPTSAEDATSDPVRLELATYTQSPTIRIYQLLLEEAYARIGVTIGYHQMPVPRAMRQVSNGSLDGVLMSSKPVDTDPTLIRVSEPFPPMIFKLMALKSFKPEALDPKLEGYTVGYIHGIRLLQRQFNAAETIAAQGGYDQLFRLLRHKRVDVIAIGEWDAAVYLAEDDELKLFAEPEFPFLVYHVLNRRHQHLVDELTVALRQVKNDGCLDRVVTYVLNEGGDENRPLPPRPCLDIPTRE